MGRDRAKPYYTTDYIDWVANLPVLTLLPFFLQGAILTGRYGATMSKGYSRIYPITSYVSATLFHFRRSRMVDGRVEWKLN
jgi:hypothetical protein